MRIIADLHLHSKYSRATSSEMNLEGMSEWAKLKGINLLGTGDFTHPRWLEELQSKLVPSSEGIFSYNEVNFILSAEVSNIFQRKDKTHKVHTVILSPSFEIAQQLRQRLSKYGELSSDGRPTLNMDVAEMAEVVMETSQKNMLIPAHAWTPWFSVFGSNAGFDSLKECYCDMEKHIYALETGLSSDPKMNWRLSSLDKYALISNSDAHSPAKLGREANVFDLKELTYDALMQAIREKDKEKFLCTYEFFPEEGKYHADGHRACGILLMPKQTKKYGRVCPVCKKPLTIGVLHRVEELADREEGYVPPDAIPFESLVPLQEIIAKVLKKGEYALAVREEYGRLIKYFGSEFAVLHAKEEDLKLAGNTKIAEAIGLMQKGKLSITPGYDGVFGKIEFEGRRKREEYASQTTLGEF